MAALAAQAREKATLTFKDASSDPDERPVMVEVVAAVQDNDYALKLEFNRPPWGEACGTRCANATLFIDTDDSAATGLKLPDPKAAETGADLAITVQGVRALGQGAWQPRLKVKVKQYAEDASSADHGIDLAELDPRTDGERVLADGASVYLLIDANIGNLPVGKRMRVIYHPPGAKALEGRVKGLAAPGGGRVELFKDGKLSNPVKKKKQKSDYEKL